jgi:hypothetical protein
MTHNVSGNGATEVARWALYQTTPSGDSQYWVSSVPRRGFETMITYRGYASHVMVAALDRDGNSLGQSAVIATVAPAALNNTNWTFHSSPETQISSSQTIINVFIFGIAAGIVVGLLLTVCWCFGTSVRFTGLRWMSRHRDHQHYEAVASVDEGDEVEKVETDLTTEESHAIEVSEFTSGLEHR